MPLFKLMVTDIWCSGLLILISQPRIYGKMGPVPGPFFFIKFYMVRILLAEDKQSSREFLAVVLTSYGHEVTPVENGALAWEEIKTLCYDLVLTDHNMPELTGAALIEKMRADSRYDDIPAVIITGNDPVVVDEIVDGVEKTTVLPKPVFFITPKHVTELRRVIDNLSAG